MHPVGTCIFDTMMSCEGGLLVLLAIGRVVQTSWHSYRCMWQHLSILSAISAQDLPTGARAGAKPLVMPPARGAPARADEAWCRKLEVLAQRFVERTRDTLYVSRENLDQLVHGFTDVALPIVVMCLVVAHAPNVVSRCQHLTMCAPRIAVRNQTCECGIAMPAETTRASAFIANLAQFHATCDPQCQLSKAPHTCAELLRRHSSLRRGLQKFAVPGLDREAFSLEVLPQLVLHMGAAFSPEQWHRVRGAVHRHLGMAVPVQRLGEGPGEDVLQPSAGDDLSRSQLIALVADLRADNTSLRLKYKAAARRASRWQGTCEELRQECAALQQRIVATTSVVLCSCLSGCSDQLAKLIKITARSRTT